MLIVDDEEDEYLIVADLLRRGTGSTAVEWCSEFDLALKVLVRSDAVDVALVDYRLGARTGLELIQEAARLGSTTPAILLTGFGDEMVDAAALEAGARDYLSKNELTPQSLSRSIRYCHQNAKSEKSLASALSHVEALLSAIPDVMLRVDHTGACLDHHGPVQGMAGLELEAPTIADLLWPEGRAPTLEAVQSAIETHQPKEVRFHTGGSDPATFEARVVPIFDAHEAVVIVRDITTEAAAAAALREQAALDRRFRVLVEAAGDAVVAIDADRRIVLVNEVAEALFGHSRDELTGRSVDSLLPSRLHRALATHVRNVLGDRGRRPMGEHVELSGLRSDGTEFPIEVSIAPLGDSDSLAAVAIARDVTQQHLAAEALKRREAELEELVTSRGQLIASISHEIRTPLSAITGYAQLLHEDAGALTVEERHAYVKTLVDQGNELSNIVDDLLVAAKAEAGRLAVVRVSVDLLAETGRALEAIAETETKRITVTGPATDGSGDPQRVRQIIRNLVTNAIRYGGSTIEIRTEIDAEGHHLMVIDDGDGIPTSHEEQIFERYHRAHETPGVTNALGIGLSISRTLARLMEGDLTYRRDGDRSVFQLTLQAVE